MQVEEDAPLVADTAAEGTGYPKHSCRIAQDGRFAAMELGVVELSRLAGQECPSLLFPEIPRQPGPSGR